MKISLRWAKIPEHFGVAERYFKTRGVTFVTDPVSESVAITNSHAGVLAGLRLGQNVLVWPTATSLREWSSAATLAEHIPENAAVLHGVPGLDTMETELRRLIQESDQQPLTPLPTRTRSVGKTLRTVMISRSLPHRKAARAQYGHLIACNDAEATKEIWHDADLLLLRDDSPSAVGTKQRPVNKELPYELSRLVFEAKQCGIPRVAILTEPGSIKREKIINALRPLFGRGRFSLRGKSLSPETPLVLDRTEVIMQELPEPPPE